LFSGNRENKGVIDQKIGKLRKKQLFTAGWLKELQQDSSTDYSYKEANNYLASLGYPLELNSDGTFAGAIPESSLNFCSSSLRVSGKPIIGLHVGNFVGISLAYN